MKTLITFLFAVIISFDPIVAQENSETRHLETRKSILRELNRTVYYPDFLTSDGKAEVIVSVHLSEQGALEINDMSATHPQLVPFVQKFLSRIKLSLPIVDPSEIFYFRLKFIPAC